MHRLLDNGVHITRARSPVGDGYCYYVDGGPEGKVLVIDTFLIPLSILSACLAWDLDTKCDISYKDPRLEFNKKVFV